MSLAREFSLPVDHAFGDGLIAFFVCRDPPVSPPAQRFIDASALNKGPQEQPAGQNLMMTDPPSLYNTASPSPPSTLQIPSKEVDYGSGPIFPEDRGESPGAGEDQNGGPHASPKEMSRHPSLGTDDNHSGSDPVSPDNRGQIARTYEDPNETLHASPRAQLQDPPLHTDYNDSGPHTDPQDTLGGGNTFGGDVSDKGSGELLVINLFLALLRSA